MGTSQERADQGRADRACALLLLEHADDDQADADADVADAIDALVRIAREDAHGDVGADLGGVSPERAGALGARALEVLASAPPAERRAGLANLFRWGLPASLDAAGRRAFCAAIIDEAAAAPATRADAAMLLLRDGDRDALAALVARRGAEGLAPEVGVRALLSLDPVEAFEELHTIYRRDRGWRMRIARYLDARADPRWIDEALAVFADDPEAAALTLGGTGHPRALEELTSLRAGAPPEVRDHVDDAVAAWERARRRTSSS